MFEGQTSSCAEEDILSKDDVILRVIATLDETDGTLAFALKGKIDPQKGKLRGCTLRIREDSGPVRITFKLRGLGGLKFRSSNPIVIDRVLEGQDMDCPGDPALSDASQSAKGEARDCLAGFKLEQNLAVTDEISISRATTEPAKFVYSLWFVDRQQREHEFDPIIKNIARP